MSKWRGWDLEEARQSVNFKKFGNWWSITLFTRWRSGAWYCEVNELWGLCTRLFPSISSEFYDQYKRKIFKDNCQSKAYVNYIRDEVLYMALIWYYWCWCDANWMLWFDEAGFPGVWCWSCALICWLLICCHCDADTNADNDSDAYRRNIQSRQRACDCTGQLQSQFPYWFHMFLETFRNL